MATLIHSARAVAEPTAPATQDLEQADIASSANTASTESSGSHSDTQACLEHLAYAALFNMRTSDVPQKVLKKESYAAGEVFGSTLFAKEHGTVYITAVLADVLHVKRDSGHKLAANGGDIDVIVSQNGFVWKLEAVCRSSKQVRQPWSFWKFQPEKKQVMDRGAVTLVADYSSTKGFTSNEWLALMSMSVSRTQVVYESQELSTSFTLADILGTSPETQEFHLSIQDDGKTLAVLGSRRRSQK